MDDGNENDYIARVKKKKLSLSDDGDLISEIFCYMRCFPEFNKGFELETVESLNEIIHNIFYKHQNLFFINLLIDNNENFGKIFVNMITNDKRYPMFLKNLTYAKINTDVIRFVYNFLRYTDILHLPFDIDFGILKVFIERCIGDQIFEPTYLVVYTFFKVCRDISNITMETLELFFRMYYDFGFNSDEGFKYFLKIFKILISEKLSSDDINAIFESLIDIVYRFNDECLLYLFKILTIYIERCYKNPKMYVFNVNRLENAGVTCIHKLEQRFNNETMYLTLFTEFLKMIRKTLKLPYLVEQYEYEKILKFIDIQFLLNLPILVKREYIFFVQELFCGPNGKKYYYRLDQSGIVDNLDVIWNLGQKNVDEWKSVLKLIIKLSRYCDPEKLADFLTLDKIDEINNICVMNASDKEFLSMRDEFLDLYE